MKYFELNLIQYSFSDCIHWLCIRHVVLLPILNVLKLVMGLITRRGCNPDLVLAQHRHKHAERPICAVEEGAGPVPTVALT